MLTWVASPLFNLTLRFNRFGRLALTSDERTQSNWIGGCFFTAAFLFVVNLLTDNTQAFLWMIFFGLMIFPLAVTFRQPVGRPRLLAALYAGAVALIGVAALVLVFLNIGAIGGFNTLKMFQAFFWGAILSTWLSAFIGPGRIGG